MAVVPVGIDPLHIIARAANDPSVLTITERAPTRALSQLKVPASVLNVKALVGIFIQEKALVGAFSVIVKTNGSYAAQVIAMPLLTLQPRMPPLSDLVLRHMRLLSQV